MPVFEELPGWSEDISEINTFANLPANCNHYVRRIAELVEAPICALGVGRRRDQTIILDPEMLTMRS